jgi:hypothetical protein
VSVSISTIAEDSGGLCVIVADGTDGNAIGAQISNVTLVDRTKSGMAVYRITVFRTAAIRRTGWTRRQGTSDPAALSETQKLC